jgi:hypothetical protein
VERIGVVPFGLSHDRELQVGDQRVGLGDEREIDVDALAHTRLRAVLADPFPIRGIGEPSSEGRQLVLGPSVLNMRQ